MADLRIRLFGSLEVRREGELLPAFSTERSRHLFAFLVLHRERLFHRDVLCGRLWGDQPESDARKILRTALWRLRTVLEPGEEDDGTVLHVEGQQIGFPGTDSAWVDVSAFLERIEEPSSGPDGALDSDGARRCLQAVSLYRGDLLEGIYGEEWCTFHRERFRLAHLTCLERLLKHFQKREEWLDAIAWGRRLLRRDPLREHVHRALMACHFAMGDRPSALRQYDRCAQVLAEELGIEPMPETRRLRARILEADRGRTSERASPPGTSAGDGSGGREESAGPVSMAREVEGALEELYALADRLERARQALLVGVRKSAETSGIAGAGSASLEH